MGSGRRRALLAGLAALAAVALCPGAAAAHAGLEASTPANGARLDTGPAVVRLAFTERPDPALSRVEVYDPTGAKLAGQPAPGPGGALVVPITGRLGPGTYTVSWQVTSAVDGHPTAGVVVFGVGAPPGAANPAAPTQAGPGAPPPAAAAGRALFYAGLLLALGCAAAGLWIYGGTLPEGRGRLVWAAPILAGLGLAGMAVGQWQAAGAGLGAVAASTPGRFMFARLLGVLVVAVACGRVADQPSRRRLATLGLAAGALTLAHVLAGHAAAPDPQRPLELASQGAHVLAAGVWVGGLGWLLAGLHQSGRVGRAVRFSRLATGGLAVVATTGLWRALDELGGWSALWQTGWGRTLAVKAGLVGLLVAGGAYNRWRAIPALAGTAAPLGRGLRVELAAGACVLAATGLLATLGPGRPPPPPPDPTPRAAGVDYARTTRLELALPAPGRLEATLVDERRRRPTDAATLTLEAVPAARPDQPPAHIPLRRVGVGRFTGPASALEVPGRWELVATVTTPAGAGLRVPLGPLDVLDNGGR